MSECELCDKERSILAVTGSQIPVGEKCYSKLISRDAVWNQETGLKKIEQLLDTE